ncbi:hypothetical protein BC628DRAFT_1421689 [Trametes gibbosa]|nr:hypothetical protein BC628DRAFT_1421689 [Trametes gibbosa]
MAHGRIAELERDALEKEEDCRRVQKEVRRCREQAFKKADQLSLQRVEGKLHTAILQHEEVLCHKSNRYQLLEKKYSDLDDDRTALREQIRDLHAEIAALRSHREAMIQDHNAAVKALQSQLNFFEQENASLASEAHLYHERSDALVLELGIVTSDLDKAKTAYINLEWCSEEQVNTLKTETKEKDLYINRLRQALRKKSEVASSHKVCAYVQTIPIGNEGVALDKSADIISVDCTVGCVQDASVAPVLDEGGTTGLPVNVEAEELQAELIEDRERASSPHGTDDLPVNVEAEELQGELIEDRERASRVAPHGTDDLPANVEAEGLQGELIEDRERASSPHGTDDLPVNVEAEELQAELIEDSERASSPHGTDDLPANVEAEELQAELIEDRERASRVALRGADSERASRVTSRGAEGATETVESCLNTRSYASIETAGDSEEADGALFLPLHVDPGKDYALLHT